MPFDFDLVAVPFRMQPGLRRLAEDAGHLTPLAEGSPLWHEKRAVAAAGQSLLRVPGFDERPVLEAIAARARLEGHAFDPAQPLETRFEEDFAVLDGATATLPWLRICVPSHWAPEEKLGLPFAAVHAPVADNRLLVAAGQQLVQLATGGDRWERFVWTITPSGRYDQHPRRHAREPWPQDDPGFASRCWLRWERQTFFPVGQGTRLAVFTIRVSVQPLEAAVDTPQKAQRLHESLASMTQAVLAYKSLLPAREPLLRWLASRTR